MDEMLNESLVLYKEDRDYRRQGKHIIIASMESIVPLQTTRDPSIWGGGDPTNTQNVWTANFCEVDVNTCTRKMLPYLWAVSIVGVILGAMLYF